MENIENETYSNVSRVEVNETFVEEPCETYIVIPPDGGWGWMVVLGAFVSFLISDGLIYSFGIFLNDISISLNCSKSQVAMAGAIMSGFFCLTGPFVAALVNRFGYNKIAIVGSFFACLSCVLTSFSSTISFTYITFGLIGGAGFCLMYLPAIIAVGFYFERWRALATGIAVCGSGVGGIVFPPILTILLEKIGWRYTFRIMGLMSLGSSICGALYCPLKPTRIKELTIKLDDVESKEKSKVFGRFHNASHPTIAEVHSKSRPAISNCQSISQPNESEKSEKATFSTVTIYRTKKLDDKISSEFVMSTSASKVSFKVPKGTETGDSKLSTIYEEGKKRKDNTCTCCKSQNDEDGSCCQCGDCLQCGCCDTKVVDESTITRPLYRDDIFFSGSLILLTEYKKHSVSHTRLPTTSVLSKSKPSIEYIMRVTRTITQNELNEVGTCKVCTESIKRTLATMLDISLFRSNAFILLTLHALFVSMGSYTPYMFIQDRAVQFGIAEDTALWLISTIGVTNTLGRISCGILTSFSIIKANNLSCLSLFFGGIITMFSGTITNVWAQFLYAALYGLSIACMSALRTIIMVETIGLEKLTNAIGIMLMFQGAALLSGTILAGVLRDINGNYEMSFLFAGGCISLGSLFLILIKDVKFPK